MNIGLPNTKYLKNLTYQCRTSTTPYQNPTKPYQRNY